jgi:monofunctional biosynthetic peptidoglycan transglycosylase
MSDANADSIVLLDFSLPEVVAQFSVINDGVMGGISTSRLRAVSGAMVFEGEVSLENNGGFASFRGPVRFPDLLTPPGALLLTVRGDERRYKLTLKLDNSSGTSQYQAAFIAPGEWKTLRFEPSDFTASFRGRSVSAPPVRFDDVRYVGLIISDQQSGAFRVELKALGAE